ncbi:MAG: hypothetical protein HY020_06965 [Burkholderiales bacterium]|nr:hypothetical protein [Burkholderiales bacterium]
MRFTKFVSLCEGPSRGDLVGADVSSNELLDVAPELTVLKGAFRFVDDQSRKRWTKIVEAAFPGFEGIIEVFGFDWTGRAFGIDTRDDEIVRFDPDTGDTVTAAESLFDFLENELVEWPDDMVELAFFQAWRDKHGPVPVGKCVGFKTPLRLGGKDEDANKTVSDLEVYWDFAIQIRSQTAR